MLLSVYNVARLKNSSEKNGNNHDIHSFLRQVFFFFFKFNKQYHAPTYLSSSIQMSALISNNVTHSPYFSSLGTNWMQVQFVPSSQDNITFTLFQSLAQFQRKYISFLILFNHPHRILTVIMLLPLSIYPPIHISTTTPTTFNRQHAYIQNVFASFHTLFLSLFFSGQPVMFLLFVCTEYYF